MDDKEFDNLFKDNNYLPKAFENPIDYQEPKYDDLSNNFTQPQFNSINYKIENSRYIEPNEHLPYYTAIDCNDDGLFVMASNNFATYVYDGVISGNYNFEDFSMNQLVDQQFVLKLKANISNLKFLNNKNFVIATSESNLMFCNTSTKSINSTDTGLFALGTQRTDGQINCIDTFKGSNLMVTGTSKGNIDLFELDTTTIQQVKHYEVAHLLSVTGLSTHPSKDNLWISTSLDKSCVLWDKNAIRPASFLLKKHQDCLTDAKWITDNLILLADASGILTVLDPRNTKVMVNQQTVSNRSIHTLKFAKNAKTFGVLSDNPVAKIFKIDDAGKLKFIHEHSAHPNILYAMVWCCKDENSYYVVGEKKYAKKITIVSET